MKSYSRCALRPFFSLLPLAFLFSLIAGCYSYSHDITLNRYGSGTLKTYIERLQVSRSPRIKQRAKQDCEEVSYHWGRMEGVQMKSCQSWIEDYRVFEEALYTFDDVSVLSTEGWSFSWERDGSYKVFAMSYDTREEPPDEDEKMETREETAGFHGVSFSVTLPKMICEAPGAVIDGNTATWDYPWNMIIDEGMTEFHMEARVKLNLFQRLFGW